MLHQAGMVRLERDGSTAIAYLVGEFDMDDTPSLEESLRPILDETPRVLELDMRDVSFFGSSGVNTLVVLREAIVESGGLVRISSASRIVERVFEATGLDGAFGLTRSA